MKSLRLWAGVAAVFFCGLVIGGVAGGYYQRERSAERIRKIRSGGEAFLATLTLNRLQRKVGLEPAQVARIEPLIKEAFEHIRQIREEEHPRLVVIVEEASRQIKSHLTAEQISTLDQEAGGMIFRLPGTSHQKKPAD